MSAEPAIGSLLSDRYLLVEELGRGAMGVVYRAHHTLLDRSVAIKVLHLTSAVLVARFRREARLLARIDHDNVCGVTDFGTTGDPGDDLGQGGRFFLVMEHVEGDTLADHLLKNGRLPVPRALAIFRQVAEGLAHCHDVGVIHRDLKPDNIMVSRDASTGHATVKIIDFGIAIAANREPGSSRVTQANVVLGTPAFMSPEQATGAVLDARSDLYALGVVIYEAVAGVNPFDTDDAVMTLANQLHVVPAPLSEAAPDLDIPHALDVLVARLLAKAPAERPQSAAEVAAALAILERGGDTVLDLRPPRDAATEAVPGPPAPEPPPSRRPLVAALALLLVALLIAAVALTTGSAPDTDSNGGPSTADGGATAVAPEVAPDAVPGLEVLAHTVAADVVDREPRGVADRFTLDAGRVYCHAVVKNRSRHRKIVVAWSQDGEPRGEVDLRVGASEGWHTWAVLHLAPNRVGAWRCDVRAETGELLSSRPFTVVE